MGKYALFKAVIISNQEPMISIFLLGMSPVALLNNTLKGKDEAIHPIKL